MRKVNSHAYIFFKKVDDVNFVKNLFSNIYIYIYIYFCLIRIIENKQKLDSWKWTLNANITNGCFLKYLYYIKNDEKKVNPPPFKISPFLVSPILTRSSKSPPCQTSENPVTPPLLGEGVQTLYLLPCNICHDFSKVLKTACH